MQKSGASLYKPSNGGGTGTEVVIGIGTAGGAGVIEIGTAGGAGTEGAGTEVVTIGGVDRWYLNKACGSNVSNWRPVARMLVLGRPGDPTVVLSGEQARRVT